MVFTLLFINKEKLFINNLNLENSMLEIVLNNIKEATRSYGEWFSSATALPYPYKSPPLKWSEATSVSPVEQAAFEVFAQNNNGNK